MKTQILLKAIKFAGGPSVLAEKLGISKQAVSLWKKPPAARCIDIENATLGKVTRYELRPDIYGKKPSKRRSASVDSGINQA